VFSFFAVLVTCPCVIYKPCLVTIQNQSVCLHTTELKTVEIKSHFPKRKRKKKEKERKEKGERAKNGFFLIE